MAQREAMNIMEFMKRFGTEEACREYLYNIRWSEGFVCPKCGTVDAPYQIKCRNQYQCRHCTHQASVTAGTIMDKTRTALTKWFMAIYLMGQDKRGCSALKLKRELGIAYDTAWTMSHKIRKAMGERDSNYLLSGIVEMDDSFFGGAHVGSKRGRGTDKTPVIFSLSLNRKGRPLYLRAQVVKRIDGETVRQVATKHTMSKSVLRSDGLPAYKPLSAEGYQHESEVFDPNVNPEHLKWIHVVIANAKSFIAGTYHGLSNTHLQAFLDEYCFRFNRRHWTGQIFARTLAACMFAGIFTRRQLIMA
jgi:transposase-like protein/predicted RNA-binding Zn-ribbon protein involved in translation (DUF1610 family)